MNAGEAFYCSPGHVYTYDEDAELIEFSPLSQMIPNAQNMERVLPSSTTPDLAPSPRSDEGEHLRQTRRAGHCSQRDLARQISKGERTLPSLWSERPSHEAFGPKSRSVVSNPGHHAAMVGAADDFDVLVADGERAPVGEWDFSWLASRATEDRPSWRYFDRVAESASHVRELLDVECGIGHMLAKLPIVPPIAVGVEAWPPSVRVAAPALGRRGVRLVVGAANALPLTSNAFQLVTSRHPSKPQWHEIARVLRPGGIYFAQHVGPHSLRELREFLAGPDAERSDRDPEVERRAAEDAGLVIRDLRSERTKVAFFDIGAVVYFLRLVVWTVPGFTVEGHRDRLLELHERILREGVFEATSSRLLVEAVKDGSV